MFPEHAERSFLDPEYSFVAVRRIFRTIFAKQKFAQLRTNYVRRICHCVREQMFAQLRTGFTLYGTDPTSVSMASACSNSRSCGARTPCDVMRLGFRTNTTFTHSTQNVSAHASMKNAGSTTLRPLAVAAGGNPRPQGAQVTEKAK